MKTHADGSVTYEAGDLQTLWVQAGGNPAAAPVAAAIALAESTGNPANTNPTDNGGTQTSWGLWQISDGTHNAPAGWSDPLTNARMAVAKYNAAGGSFARDWGTFSSGAYLRYLGTGSSSATVTGTVQQFIASDTAGSSNATVYGQPVLGAGAAQSVAQQSQSVTPPGTGGLFGPVIDAANTIATEVFLGALAVALLSGGILWLASEDTNVRAALKGA